MPFSEKNAATETKAPELGANILLVDDDGEIRKLVAQFLRTNGHRVQTARSGADMFVALEASSIDLVILDLMLPGTGGLELCRQLRKTSAIPVVMLTAKSDDVDRIVGLEVGADDYLSKPFNPRELLARVNAVLRRSRMAAGDPLLAANRGAEFAGWRLDKLKRELTNPHGVVVDLSTAEFDLLLAFLDAPQRVLNREYLLDVAKNRATDAFDRSVDVQVSRLRRKMKGDVEIIKTIRGVGYMFAPDVKRT